MADPHAVPPSPHVEHTDAVPTEFENTVHKHANLPDEDRKYTGDNFSTLSRYLRQRRHPPSHADGIVQATDRDTHAFAVLQSPETTNEPVDVLKDGPTCGNIASRTAHLLFLRGSPSPAALKELAAKVHLDPEFVNRHMAHPAFMAEERDLFNMPASPSATTNVFQLTLTTVFSREGEVSTYGPVDLRHLRRTGRDAMTNFRQNSRKGAKLGDSIVRDFHVLSRKHYAIEQLVTICVEPASKGWQVAVWLDVGRDLGKSAPGPWSPLPSLRDSWETYVYPIVQYIPDLAKYLNTIEPSTKPNAARKAPREVRQSASILPYSIDKITHPEDAVNYLHDPLRLITSAENQFLNLVQRHVSLGAVTTGANSEHAFDNLQHFQGIAEEHGRRLHENLRTLWSGALTLWVRSEPSSQVRADSDRLTKSHIEDFTYLLDKALAISAACTRAIDAIHSKSTLLQNQKTFENAETVRRLTLIATIFIPISFTCTVFGMNFVEFGTGSLKIWVWLAISIPVLVLSIFLYNVSLPDLWRAFLKLLGMCVS